MNLDDLLQEAVTVGRLGDGGDPAFLEAQGFKDAVKLAPFAPTSNRRSPANRWTARELEEMDRRLAVLPLDEVARLHGRSINAVKTMAFRRGIRLPTKRDEEVSATMAASKLGWCGKKMIRLIDLDAIPARVATTNRRILMVRVNDLKRWLIQPESWLYFKVDRIVDRGLKRLVMLAQSRWHDQWWTTGQVARYHGLPSSKAVNKRIHAGKLPAVRWQNWMVKRSDAVGATFTIGKGSAGNLREWSVGCDSFLALANGVGLPSTRISELAKLREKEVAYRLQVLGRKKRTFFSVDLQNGRYFADWRLHKERFPALVTAVGRFLTGEKMTTIDLSLVRGVLVTWLWRHADYDVAKKHSQMFLCLANVTAVYELVKEHLGFDPLMEVGDA